MGASLLRTILDPPRTPDPAPKTANEDMGHPRMMTMNRKGSSMRRRRSRIVEAVLVGTLAVAVLGSTLAIRSTRDDLAFFDPIIDVKALLDARYVRELDDRDLQLGAIQGMLEVLDDPYTQFVPGEQRAEFEKALTGEYAGIGAQITIRDGWLTVVTPLEDSPAYRAGLMADDRIVEIEGEPTLDITADEAVARLTGEPGTVVHIVVERDGLRIPIEITRQRIKTHSVKGVTRKGDGDDWEFFLDHDEKLAYLRLTQFTPACAEEVRAALEEMGAPDGRVAGLVFDLRWNPGGVLEDAVRIADLFLEEGVIVSTKGRTVPETVSRAIRPGTLPDFPVVLLVNDTSASASEVLAGALSENNRAIVLGTRTFGKGSVQSVYLLPSAEDGSELKITEQLYYLPSGRSIHRMPDSAVWGVDPTPGFYVPIDDRQEFELFEARRQREIIRQRGDDEEAHFDDPEWIEQQMKDPQLAAALRALRLYHETGTWVPTGKKGISGNELAGDELRRLRLARERLIRELARIDRREEALIQAAGDVDAQVPDLWDDAIDLTGGELIVRDADGNEVARLRITGNRLERWLIDADVQPEPVGSN